MMVTIPRQEPSQGLDTSATTMANVRVNTSPFEAIEQVGRSVTGVAEQIQARREKLEDFKAQQGWALLNSKLDGDFQNSQQNSNDDGTDAFPNFDRDSFAPKTQEFLSSLPPRLRQEYEPRVPVLRQNYSNDGDKFSYQKTDANTTAMLGDYATTLKADLAANPENFDQALMAINELIGKSGKTQSARNLFREKYLNEFLSSAVDGYIAKGDFDGARALVQKSNALSAKRSEDAYNSTVTIPKNGILTPGKWPLRFYKPEDLMGRRPDEQWITAEAGYAADQLGQRFFNKTGIRVEVNLPHHFDPGPVAGRRRGTSSTKNSPHVSKSQHHRGAAIDFQIQGLSDNQKAEFLREGLLMGFKGVGFYEGGAGHLHLDTGNARKWGKVPAWAEPVMAQYWPPKNNFGKAVAEYSAQSQQAQPVQVAANENAKVSDAETVIQPGTKYSTLSKRINAAERVYNKTDENGLKARRREVQMGLADRLVDGTLKAKDVDDAKEFLTPSDYIRFHKAVKEATTKSTKAETLKMFSDRLPGINADNLQEFEDDLIDARINNEINQTDLAMLRRRARSQVGGDPNYDNQLVAIYRDRVRVQLKPDDDSDTVQLLRRLQGIEDFDAAVNELKKQNKPITRESLKRFVDDAVKANEEDKMRDGRSKLEMSPYLKGKGRFLVTEEDVAKAAKDLLADKGRLDVRTFEKQKNIIFQWAEQLAKESKK